MGAAWTLGKLQFSLEGPHISSGILVLGIVGSPLLHFTGGEKKTTCTNLYDTFMGQLSTHELRSLPASW